MGNKKYNQPVKVGSKLHGKILESYGLLDYQTRGEDIGSISDRYARLAENRGIQVQGDWFQQHYGRSYSPSFGPGAFNTQNKPSSSAIYKPTYWEDPKSIASWYTKLQADPNTVLPDGVSADVIKGAYNYMSLRNGSKDPANWTYLTADDPFRGFLSNLTAPGLEFMSDYEAAKYGQPTAQQAITPAQRNPYAQDFDWTKLSIAEKQRILRDPTFSIKDVPMAQQGLILSDKEFDLWGKSGWGDGFLGTPIGADAELPWWQPLAFTAMSNPKTAPIAQSAFVALTSLVATKNPAYAAAMGGGLYAANIATQSDKPAVQKLGTAAMVALNWLSEKAEQSAGMLDYLTGANLTDMGGLLDPERSIFSGETWKNLGRPLTEQEKKSRGLPTQNWAKFLQDPEAAWEAQRLYYETSGGEQVWILGEGEKVQVKPGYTLEDARKRIMTGEDPMLVLEDFQREYGATGLIRDFVFQSVFDPLEVMPSVAGSVRAKIADVKAVRAGVDTPRGKIETLKAEAYRTKPSATGMPVPFSEPAKYFRDAIRTRLTTTEAKHLNWHERWLAGLTTDGAIKDLQPTKPGAWNTFRNLTPESKAILSANMMKENLSGLINWMGDDITPRQMLDVVQAAARGDMETVKNMGAEFLDNPEFYTSIGAVRSFLPDIERMVSEFEVSEPNRAAFWQIVETLGEEPGQVLKNFLDGDPTPDFEMLRTKGGDQVLNQVADLLKIDRANLTPDSLAEALRIFEAGKTPIHPQEFKARMLDQFYEHMGKWGVETFGVKKATQVEEALRFMKNAQSLLLLDFSPSYLVNNFLNNRVVMAMGGVYGLTPEAKMDAWIRDFGIEPARYDEGFGPAQMETGTSTAGEIVKDATRGSGPATKLADASAQVRSKVGIMSKASSVVEKNSSKQMYYSAMKSFYGRQWRAGRGFEKMPAALERALADGGLDPQVVYRNIEGMLNPQDLAKLIDGATTRNVSTFINDAATALGRNPDDVTDMLSRIGVLDQLREDVAKATTIEEMDRAFDRVEQRAIDQIDIMATQALDANMQHAAQKAKAEGFPGIIQLFSEIELDRLERKLENDQLWDQTWERTDPLAQAKRWDLVYQELGRAANKNRDAWRRTNAREMSIYKGVLDGLGMDSAFKVEFLARKAEQQQALTSFFEYKQKAYDKLRRTQFASVADYRAAKYNLELDLQRKFNQANNKALKIQGEMDKMFAKEFGRVFGPGAEQRALKWRKDVLSKSTEIHQAIMGHRAEIQDLPFKQRAKRWEEFKPEYQAMWRERTGLEIEGANKLYRGDDQTGPTGPGPQGPEPAPGLTPEAKAFVDKATSDGAMPAFVTNNLRRVAQENGVTVTSDMSAADVLNELKARDTQVEPALAQDAQVQEQQAQVVAQQMDTVRGIGNEFGIPTADETGTPIPGADTHLLNAIKKYGDGEVKTASRLEDITPEQARAAMEKRQAIQDAQTTLDDALRPRLDISEGDRRIPAYQKLREIWTKLDEKSRQEAFDWVTGETLIDPRSGLETLVAKNLEGAKPAGWYDGAIDLNALKAINDHWGHQAGDAVIAGMGAVIREEVEAAGGRAFRVGGDEVSLWFPSYEAGLFALQQIDNRFRNAIVEIEIDGEIVQKKGFTVSYGIGESETLADQALYQDKSRRFDLGERAERGEIPRSIDTVPGDTGETVQPDTGQVPEQTVEPEPEPTPDPLAARRAEVQDLVTNKPLAEIPQAIREPLTRALNDMLAEVQAGRRKPLLEFIKEKGGLDYALLRDLTGEEKVQRRWGPGLFKKKGGIALDELIVYMAEEGYLTRLEIDNPNDNGGMRYVADLIREELAGNKQYSPADGGIEPPAWMQEIRGLKNKQAQLEASILRMMNGQDNAAFGLDVPATDRAIKAEAFSRLADEAAIDGKLADLTGHQFDLDGWQDTIHSIGRRAAATDNMYAMLDMIGELDNMLDRLPDEMRLEQADAIAVLQDELIGKMAELENRELVRNMQDQADAAIKAQEERGQALMTREAWREKLIDEMNVSPEQADAFLFVNDGIANWHERMTGESSDQFWSRYFGDVIKAENGKPDLLQNGLPADRELIAAHNLSQNKLLFAEDIGGIAMPSLAITKKDIPFDNYGDITLLADKRMIDPRSNVQVTDADAYTPRYPSVEYIANRDKITAWVDDNLAAFEEVYGPDEAGRWRYDPQNIVDEFGRDGLGAIENNELFMARYLMDNGYELPERPTRLRTAIQDAGLYDDFVNFAETLARDFEQGKRMFKGYTNAGYRRYADYTLDNVIRYMKSQWKEGENFNYGAGSLRAKGAKKFRSIDAIRKESGRLVPGEDFKQYREYFNKRLSELATENAAKNTNGERNQFIVADRFTEALALGVQERNIPGVLEEYGFRNVDLEPIYEYLDELFNAPTEYFEAKVKRGVTLDEFKVAIVPDDVRPEVRAALENAGLTVYEYTPDGPGSRLEAIERATSQDQDLLFQSVYHGSPYRFDKFTLDKIGSGEGAQAYGWGLYFAGDRSVAEWYRETLSDRNKGKLYKGKPIDQYEFDNPLVRNAAEHVARYHSKLRGETPAELIDRMVQSHEKEAQRWKNKNTDFDIHPVPVPYRYSSVGVIKFPLEMLLTIDQAQVRKSDYSGGWHIATVDERGVPNNVGFFGSQSEAQRSLDYWQKVMRDPDTAYSVGGSGRTFNTIDEARSSLRGMYDNSAQYERNMADAYRQLDPNDFTEGDQGQVYHVDIPDDNYLLWDAPLSEQPQALKDYLASLDKDLARIINGEEIADFVKQWLPSNGEQIYNWLKDRANRYPGTDFGDPGSAKAASLELRDIGISGIKYLDGNSRRRGKGQYNYVVFDDSAIKILETYYQGVKGGVTFVDHWKGVIHAFDGNDFSTMVHEHAHIYRRMLEYTADKNQTAKADLQTVEEWAGVVDGHWTVEAEEKFARGFEQYLAEGIAPTPALVRVFESFKTWLLEIYKAIKGSDIDANLTDEVRQVFDRMVSDKVYETTFRQPDTTYNIGDIVRFDDGTQATVREVRPSSLRLDDGRVVSFTEVHKIAGQDNMFGYMGLDDGRPDAQQATMFQGETYNPGDIVRLADGSQATVKEVRPYSLKLETGKLVSIAEVQKVATQDNMFGEMGMDAGPDAQQMSLFQSRIEPVNRNLNQAEIDGYARALSRTDAGEVTRAVNGESDIRAKIALLDAIHKINPDLAKTVARETLSPFANQVRQQAQSIRNTRIDNQTLFQSAALRKKTETLEKYGLRPDEQYTTRQVAEALEQRTRELHGQIAPNDYSPEARAKIAEWMADEVEFSFTADEDTGAGWYSERFPKALDIMGEVIPDLKTDPEARALATLYMALTSDGTTPDQQIRMVDTLYKQYKETGRLDGKVAHSRKDSVNASLKAIQRVMDETGSVPATIDYLLAERTIKDHKALAAELGINFQPKYLENTVMPTAAVLLGPKLGAFFANLMGSDGYLTMDRWWSRTFNRYRGNLTTAPTETSLVAYREILGQPDLDDAAVIAEATKYANEYAQYKYVEATGKEQKYWTDLEVKVGFKEGRSSADQAKFWQAAEQYGEEIARLHKLQKSGNNIRKEANVNLQDVPRNPSDRAFMIETTREAQRILAERGIEISLADIQAVLWYYEKRLYAQYAKESPIVSYEDAAVRYVYGEDGRRPGPVSPGTAPEDGGTGTREVFGDTSQSVETDWDKPFVEKETFFQNSPLFQDGGDVPTFPPGGYDQLSGYGDYSKFFEDGWSQEVQPVLAAMRESARMPERRYNFARFDDNIQKQLNNYLHKVRNDMASTKHQAVRYGETQRDYALLNYQRQYGFDKYLLNPAVPYQFFSTRSLVNWIARAADRPAILALYARMRQMHDKYQNQLPERMRDKVAIPMPFLPEWMGGSYFVDPMQTIMPFEMYVQPLEAMGRDQNYAANNATYILKEWAENGQITPEQAAQALSTRTGATWERAIEQAKLEQGKNGYDYFSMLMSPALYASIPYYLATGKPMGSGGWPNGQLPVTRFGQGLETALKGTSLEFAGNMAGSILAGPERWAREQKGLHEFGEWGDFYIDRQLANMAAEGADLKLVQKAMIERNGELYDEAYERVRQELMLKVPGLAPLYGAMHGATLDQIIGSVLPSLLPGGILPPAEMELKGLKQEYSITWDKYNAGDKEAFTEFFEKHPEYEARMGLRKDPQERLQQFLKSEIWDAYNALRDNEKGWTSTNQKQLKAYLGPEFEDFLYGDPGVEYSTEQMATWARLLKGMVPEVPETQEVLEQDLPEIPLFDDGMTEVTDRFFKERATRFPNYYTLQQTYYSLPKSDRAGFLLRFPEYAEYRKWKDQYYKNYPDLVPVFNGEVFKRIDTSTWSPILVQAATMHAITGERLSTGAQKALEQVWIMEGRPYDNFNTWMDFQVIPALRNQLVAP